MIHHLRALWSRVLVRIDARRAPVLRRVREQPARWRHGRVHSGNSAGPAWRYGLYTPPGLHDDEKTPLIMLLHGCTQRGVRFAHASGWTDLADVARVRLLCPEQRELANQHRCWNWFHSAAQNGEGEVTVVTGMIDDVTKLVRVDAKAIAAVGVSAGGALSALLAFHCAKRFRAVITVAAPTLLGRLTVANPPETDSAHGLDPKRRGCAPLAIIHGTADTIVHPHCADRLQAQALESLRRADKHTKPKAGAAQFNGATVTDFRRRGKLLLRRIDLHGAGHAWTGGPGGHRYCEQGGAPLTALCHGFLRDVGMLA